MWAPAGVAMDAPRVEKIDDPQELLAQIIQCLEHKDSKGLKTYILEHKLKQESIIWELILKIGGYISAEISENYGEFFDVCNRCLTYLIKTGNPKEILLALLEQVDSFIDDTKFRCLLPLIQTSLLRIPKKLFHSLDIALEAVTAHIESLPLPENVQLEGEEIKVFHMDAKVVRLAQNVEMFLDFLKPFVKEVDVSNVNISEGARSEALVLKKHLIKLFDMPLCHLILTYDSSANDNLKTDSRLCAETAMEFLSKVETDFHRLIKNAKLADEVSNLKSGFDADDQKLSEEEIDNVANEMISPKSDDDVITDFVESWDFKLEMTPMAQACLAYLVHVEHLGLDKLPTVFTHDYMLSFHLDTISRLLKNTEYPVNFKGLLLCQHLANLVSKDSLSVDHLDNDAYMRVFNDLIHVMIKCPVRDHRTLATRIFPVLINRFQSSARYIIFQNILSSCDNPGLKGYLITILKNDIAEFILSTKNTQQKPPVTERSSIEASRFEGQSLHRLLKLVFSLPQGETTDILENSDQIISSLNLLRYIVMADPLSTNITGIWDYMATTEQSFLDPLRKGLELSMGHYQLELDNTLQGKEGMIDNFGKDQASMDLAVSVGGMDMSSMAKQEKVDLLRKALNTHHMIKSLLCRMSEVVDQSRC